MNYTVQTMVTLLAQAEELAAAMKASMGNPAQAEPSDMVRYLVLCLTHKFIRCISRK